jgi:hypothetical protein
MLGLKKFSLKVGKHNGDLTQITTMWLKTILVDSFQETLSAGILWLPKIYLIP